MGAITGGLKKFCPKAPALLGKFTGGQLTDME
jgi:hypothetical protein